MSRKSARNKTRVSYVELAGGEQPEPEDEPSTSKGKRKRHREDSEFEVEQEEEEEEQESDSDQDMEELRSLSPSATPSASQSSKTKLPHGKSIPNAVTRLPRRTSIHELNSRTRPGPAYFPNPAVRLASDPGLFAAQKFVEEIGERDLVSTRKARDLLGVNVGAGPALDLCEDIGWYKEGIRRPRAHEDVQIKDEDWQIVTASEGKSYNPGSPRTTTCLMGPLNNQQSVQVKPLETCSLEKYWPSCRAIVFNAGNPVWAMAWCPVSEEFAERHKFASYIAISTNPPPVPPPAPSPRLPPKSTIQIWRYGPSHTPTNQHDSGTTSLALVICLDVPPAREIEWCPLPTDSGGEPGKLGILAGVFSDGSVVAYAVPEPEQTVAEPTYTHSVRPLVRFTLPDARFTCLDWGNSELFVFGCSNGHVAVYDFKTAIQNKPTSETPGPDLSLFPTHYIPTHQSRVTSIKWIRIPQNRSSGLTENPTTIASSGADGQVFMTDIRHPGGMSINVYRCRDTIQSLAFSSYGAGIISNEHEYLVKYTGVQPIVLGRGHNVTEARGPLWDIVTSDLHPHVAIASSDGTLVTANLLKYMRKGSLMPSFIHTVYRMDYNLETKELRMLDMFTPKEHRDPRTVTKTRTTPHGIAPPNATPAQHAAAERERDGFGAWPLEIGIHCAAWQPSRLAQAGVLASGGASGLVRIDVLKGLVYGTQKDEDGGE